MSSPSTATVIPNQKRLTQWDRYDDPAIGRKRFSWKVSRTMPNYGSFFAQFLYLKARSSLVSIKDHRSIRNHSPGKVSK